MRIGRFAEVNSTFSFSKIVKELFAPL